MSVLICGGAEIYRQPVGLADRIYLTLVDAEVAADAFFSEFDLAEWAESESQHHPAGEKNHYQFTFKLLTRK